MAAEAPHSLPDKTGRQAGDDGELRSPLGRLRLLVALDVLLVESSVGKAAARLGIGAPAMSRLLKQIREVYDDPILVKTGRGMVPTPLAESLRLRLRALAAEAEDLIEAPLTAADPLTPAAHSNRAPLINAPPLALARHSWLEGGPSASSFARKLEAIGPRAEPRQRLAKFVALTGAGAGRTRPLTLEEADEAFSIVLAGEADPLQIGALLVVMHYRGVTAAELAGLAKASRSHIGAPAIGQGAADLDWPAYLSPKARFEPWFLHAARLVADAGHRVLLHGGAGLNELGERFDQAVELAGISVCNSVEDVTRVLGAERIGYLPLPAASQQLQALLALYRVFEMRSPLNLLLHLLNPGGAGASLIGAASTPTRSMHRDAAAMLGWRELTSLSVKRDVAEAAPFRLERLQRLLHGEPLETVIAARPAPRAEPATSMTSLEYWQAVWDGRALDEHARQVVIETAALALMTVRKQGEDALEGARTQAQALWKARRR